MNMFFGSYRKGKYRTFNIETEPSYAETHPKTPTPTWIWWMLQPPFSWYDNVKERYVIFIHLFDSGILLIIDLKKKKGKKGGGLQLNKCYVSTV